MLSYFMVMFSAGQTNKFCSIGTQLFQLKVADNNNNFPIAKTQELYFHLPTLLSKQRNKHFTKNISLEF